MDGEDNSGSGSGNTDYGSELLGTARQLGSDYLKARAAAKRPQTAPRQPALTTPPPDNKKWFVIGGIGLLVVVVIAFLLKRK